MDRTLFSPLHWRQLIACALFAGAGAALGAGPATPATRAGASAAQVQPAAQAAPQGLSFEEMTDRLDQLDRLDLEDALEKAASCTRREDFDCADRELAKARRVANSGADQKKIQAAQSALFDARYAVADRKDRERIAAREREFEELNRRNQPTVTVYDSGPGLPSWQQQAQQISNIHNQAMANIAKTVQQRQQEQRLQEQREREQRLQEQRQQAQRQLEQRMQEQRMQEQRQQEQRPASPSPSSTTTTVAAASPQAGSSGGSPVSSSPYGPAAIDVAPFKTYTKMDTLEGYRWTNKAQAEIDLEREIERRRDGHYGSANTVFAGDGHTEIVKVFPAKCMETQTSTVIEYKCKAQVELKITSRSAPGNGAGVSR